MNGPDVRNLFEDSWRPTPHRTLSGCDLSIGLDRQFVLVA